jgi:hypothetical protein
MAYKTLYHLTDGTKITMPVDTDLSEYPEYTDVEPDLEANIRLERNALLSIADKETLKLLTTTGITNEWKEYLQDLRDVPLQEGFPTNVTWPTKPE